MIWILRAAWVLLPVGLGPALADALSGWDSAPQATAEALLWGGWGLGLVAVLAPRPAALTVVRVGAGLALAIGAAAAPGADPVDAAGAGLLGAVAVALATLPEISQAFGDAIAYGDERRLPLRTPATIALLAAPLATLVVGAGLTAGPLLLADGNLALGIPITAVGLPVVALLARSLHALSLRWLILVPGGVVLHDPLTLVDPVLLPRDRLAGFEPGAADDALDLRLGATRGSITAHLVDRLPFAVGRGGRKAEVVEADRVVVALARPGAALEALVGHQVQVIDQAASGR